MLATLALAVAGVVGALGLRWRAHVVCRAVEVRGAQWADANVVASIAAVPIDSALYDVDPSIVADRIRRHPWVETVEIRRIPTGVLRIEIEERVPVAVVVQSGRPAYYLDRNGLRMPLVAGRAADVPVVRGVTEAYVPLVPVANPTLIEFASVLARLDEAANAIVSEIEVRRDGMSVSTTPVPGRPAIRVNMGGGDFDYRFALLAAFWSQVVLADDAPVIHAIDLRYDGQIITT
jgi:cell division protein FtsQ